MDWKSLTDKIPSGIDITEWFMKKIQLVAAFIVVILFAIGVVDLSIAIVESYNTGNLTEVSEVVSFIDFVLLLFILVEAYRTIVAYIRSKDARYILALVIYAGVIAVIRKVIVFRPSEFAGYIESMYVAIGYSILLLSLGLMLYILNNNAMEVKYGKQGGDTLEDEEENEEDDGDNTGESNGGNN